MNRMLPLLCLLPTVLFACRDRPSASTPAHPSQPRIAATPQQAFQAIRQAYEGGQLARLRPYVLPERWALLIDTLMAVNALQTANNRLHELIERYYGPRTAELLDLGGLLDYLGLFAPKVTYIRQEQPDPVEVNEATVRIQVGKHVPLERIRFVQRSGRWYYDPGRPIPEMPVVLNALARGLNLVADRLEAGPLTRDQLLSEFRTRLGPPLRRVPQVIDSDEAEVAALRQSKPDQP